MKRFFAQIVLKYLQVLTRLYVRRQKIEIIGLTGSAGKTSLTLAVHAVLSTKYKVAMTYQQGHGLNSETGIPFALLGVHVDGYLLLDWIRYLATFTWNFFFKKCSYEKFVLEMGVDKPNDMDYLLSLVQPKVGIFLSIGKVHVANFECIARPDATDEDLLKLIFDEKAKLIKKLPKGAWAILNNDDEMIRSLTKDTRAEVKTFGFDEGADIRGEIVEKSKKEFRALIHYLGKSYNFKNNKYLLNQNSFQTLLAAFAVGAIYKITPDLIITALEGVDLPPGRMTKIEGIRNTMLIDSSYNSSTSAVLEAFSNLELYADRRKIVILGDMRELGKATKREHEIIAQEAVKIADSIVLIGPAMKDYFLPVAVKSGVDPDQIFHFDNTWKALSFVKRRLIKGGEAILVKGSQNELYLEIIVEGLMKDKSKAGKLLCRRGSFWEKKRWELKK